MERELAIYVSASSEMGVEGEVLGQLLAGLTKSIRWIITRTPIDHENANPDLQALRSSQFYLILLGMDIFAPMGGEGLAAKNMGLSAFAFRNVARIPSPAAAFFAHNAELPWQRYRTPQEFSRLFEHALITQLIAGTPGYGLSVADIEDLSRRLTDAEADRESPHEEDRGAGGGG